MDFIKAKGEIRQSRAGSTRVGYLPIDSYAIIGNLRTAALVSVDASIDFCCIPTFDSPSVFARILDAKKGGHFQISPITCDAVEERCDAATHLSESEESPAFVVRKQQYAPNSNVLITKFQSTSGVATIHDWMPRPAKKGGQLVPWILRKVSAVKGTYSFKVECFPAFHYGKQKHETFIRHSDAELSSIDGFDGDTRDYIKSRSTVIFDTGLKASDDPSLGEGATCLELHTFVCFSSSLEMQAEFQKVEQLMKDSGGIDWKVSSSYETIGPGAMAEFTISDGMTVYFVLKESKKSEALTTNYYRKKDTPISCNVDVNGYDAQNAVKSKVDSCSHNANFDMDKATPSLIEGLLLETNNYWRQWLSHASYTGRWRELVQRSALVLKLLVYEPTGAMVASPTFSLPESIGGGRNWDYRYTWIRDSAFTVYAFLRLGLTEEAEGYMKFIFMLCSQLKDKETLAIMYTIHGEKCPPDTDLEHMEGYRGSRPVRIGNSANDHLQLDVYGALLDAIYLYNKFARPIGYDMWTKVRALVDYVAQNWHLPDNSIWEIRDSRRNYTYSRIMCWVALDRGLRLAEKRSLPCPNRMEWYQARDTLYEEVMEKGYNKNLRSFVMGYEAPCHDTLDASVLVMAMTFFINHTDPRLLATIKSIMRRPEEGGLLSNGSVYRYNLSSFSDNIQGEEGTFSMCTFWLIEALTRAGKAEPVYLDLALEMFEQILSYGNHVQLFSEEIAHTGEALGNHPQAFTHIALISTAFNLDRQLPTPGKSHSM